MSALTSLHWGKEEWLDVSLFSSRYGILDHVVSTDITLVGGCNYPKGVKVCVPNLATADMDGMRPWFIMSSFFSKSLLMFVLYISSWLELFLVGRIRKNVSTSLKLKMYQMLL